MEISILIAFIAGFLLAFSILNRRKSVDDSAETESCLRCGTSMNPAQRCGHCGWDLGGRIQRQGIRRVIEGLKREGKIDSELRQVMLAAFGQMVKSPEAAKDSLIIAETVVREEDQPQSERPVSNATTDQELARERGISSDQPKPLTSPKDPPQAKPGSDKLEPAATTSVQDRAQAYQASRQAAAAQQPEIKPPKPKVPWSVWFAAFMEEKNIRWGELVGGLLIVSCTIALVVTFWANIAENRFLKFGVLNGVIAALFGVGLHAAKHWRLPTTSQGILTIATLLVPLNFLAIAAFADTAGTIDPISVAGEVISVGIFSFFVFAAGQVLTPRWPRWLTIGVLVTSALQLLIKRFADDTGSAVVVYAMAVPCLLVYGIACLNPIRRYRHKASIPERYGNELLRQMGLVAFPVITAGGLLLARSTDPRWVLQQLSPLSILWALPIMSLGLLLWKRPGSSLASQRFVGSGLLVAGTIIIGAGCVAAWPQPVLMIALAVLGGVLITYVAQALRVVDAHLVSAAMFSVALVLLAHVLMGDLTWTVSESKQTVSVLFSGTTGQYLSVISLLGAVTVAGLRHFGVVATALRYAGVSAGCVILSTGLLAYFGFNVEGDPYHLTWIFAVYALILFAVSLLTSIPWAVAFGALFLMGSCYQGFFMGPWRFDSAQLSYVMFLTHASVMALIAVTATRVKPQTNKSVRITSSVIAMVVSAIVACSLLWSVIQVFVVGTPLSIGFLLWLAGVWLAMAFIEKIEGIFVAFQVVFGLLLMVLVDSYLRSRGWYELGDLGWLQPTRLQFQGLLLSIYGIAWILIRAFANKRSKDDENVTFWPFDSVAVRYFNQALLTVPTVVVIYLVLYGAIPGIAQELSSQTNGERLVPDLSSFQLGDSLINLAHNGYTWLLLAAVAVSQVVSFAENPRRWNLAALAVVVSASPLLVAANWYDTVSVASATRWAYAIYFLIGSALIWFRHPIGRWIARQSWLKQRQFPRIEWFSFGVLAFFAAIPLIGMAIFVAISAVSNEPPDSEETNWLITLAVMGLVAVGAALIIPRWNSNARGLQVLTRSAAVLASMPVFALTLFVVGRSLGSHPIIGPDHDSFFFQIGLAGSYAVPLVCMSIGMIGNAISLRSEAVSFTAGLLLTFSATAGFMLTLKGKLGPEQCIQLAQINSIVTSVYALGWMIYQRIRRWADREGAWLTAQVGIGVGFIALPLAFFTLALLIVPDHNIQIDIVTGWLGWTAFLLAVGGVMALLRTRGMDLSDRFWQFAAIGFVAMVSLQSNAFDPVTSNHWFSFGLLQVAIVVGAIVCVVLDVVRNQKTSDASFPLVSRWGWLTAVTLAYLGIRGVFGYDTQPNFPWWPIMAWLSASGLWAIRAWHTQKHRNAYLATLFANLTFSLWWTEEGNSLFNSSDYGVFFEFMLGNAIVMNAMVVLWSWLFYRSATVKRRFPSIQFISILMSMLIMTLMISINLLQDIDNWQRGTNGLVQIVALISLAIANLSCLWHPRNSLAVIGVYFAGLLASASLLDSFNLTLEPMVWNGTLVLASYGFATSYLWSRRQGIGQLLAPLRIPANDDLQQRTQTWLIPLNGLLATFVTIFALLTQFTCEVLSLRLACSQAIAAMAFSIGMLARGTRETQLRMTSLLLGTVAAVGFGWCWIDPDGPHATGLNRAVVFASAVMGMAAFYGIGLSKILRRENAWTRAGYQFVPALIVVGVSSVAVILVLEVWLYLSLGAVDLSLPGVLAVAAALLMAVASCLVAAIVPGRDPLNLQESRRAIYIYGAEGLIALLFLHLRVTMPYLFTGLFQQYWTIIVMVIAFAGVGMSEWFKRRQIEYLANPLEKTGALLPLLPVIGFWLTDQSVNYSVIMLTVGCLYAGLSVIRKSFGFGILATLAANGALWFFLHDTVQISFFLHPQLWLIPGAICVLIAAYLNRESLSPTQMNTLRYLSVSVIYASSTGDIFINGVGNAPWLPAILAAFSIAGIFVGILMRVRAFLFMGLSFLVISLMTVIWYAAVDLEQTWLWYVTGIVTGVIIIAVFAVFEKKRNEVIDVVTKLKSWD